MNVEITGRHCDVTPAIRKEVETGLTKIRKILHDKFETKVVLTVEKRRHKVEITITLRKGPLVALAQAGEMKVAINQAIDHLEKQAVKYHTKSRSKKRHDQKKYDGESTQESVQVAVGLSETTAVPIVVHKFPSIAKTTEVHLIRTIDAVAMRPMTLEEAIKEVHFRDRDVFIFRDPKGKLMVLHRTRDGKMELIETP
ncbi:MAG TPA: ribosome-associated translation inhibitor RaiA [Terriglobales bacterium]|jgi:putative sigma-54 modulation protein|nr:ribosome-associated translation inhibitor RaiA [Terriglobales bacterium]